MSLCQPDKVADSHNLMVVLAHLQGVAATFRVGRHHHRGPLHEGRGLTHALTHDAPTDLTVAAALVRKAYSRRRRSRLWSKPVNLRTWGLVSDPIAMVQAFAELRYGVVAHTLENSVKYGHNLRGTAQSIDERGCSRPRSALRIHTCLLYTSPSPRDPKTSRMPSSA